MGIARESAHAERYGEIGDANLLKIAQRFSAGKIVSKNLSPFGDERIAAKVLAAADQTAGLSSLKGLDPFFDHHSQR